MEARALQALAENVDKLVAVLTPKPVEAPKPVPLPDASRPGACRSCGWMTPPDSEGCARCTAQNIRFAPAWLTAEAIKDQMALNPGREWPAPRKRYNVQDQIRNIFTTTPRH
jgi:hypothetical protein